MNPTSTHTIITNVTNVIHKTADAGYSMNWFVVLTGSIQLVISLVVGVLFIFGAFMLFKMLNKKLNEITALKENNIAAALFSGSVIFSVCWVVKSSLEPAIDTLKVVMHNPRSHFLSYLGISGIMLGQILLAGVIAFFAVFIATLIFMALTKDIDEMAEIKKNNIAIAIILAVIIVSVALFIEPGIKEIINGLIPFPPLKYNVPGL